MLTVHHLRRSQSERIVWLCEELGPSYQLRCYDRHKTDLLAPPPTRCCIRWVSRRSSQTVTSSSGSRAIVEYLLAKHGPADLARSPQDTDFAGYLYWLHFANGTLQPIMGRNMIVRRIDLPADHPVAASMRGRLELVLSQVEARCARRPTWLAAISVLPTS